MKHRRIAIFGHQTSLRLEDDYWTWLQEIAADVGVTVPQLIEGIAASKRPNRSLTSEIRTAITAHYHGAPYPLYEALPGMIRARDGGVHVLTWGRS